MSFEFRHYLSKDHFILLKYDELDKINWTVGNNVLLIAHGWHDSFNSWMRQTRDFALTQPRMTFIALDWSKVLSQNEYVAKHLFSRKHQV